MKSTIIGGLSLLLLSSITAPSTVAQVNPNPMSENPRYNQYNRYNYDVGKVEPFNLVMSAYRGQFEPQGIPSYYQLRWAYRTGEVTAEDVVRSAVESGEIPRYLLNDEGYISAVESQLNTLTNQ